MQRKTSVPVIMCLQRRIKTSPGINCENQQFLFPTRCDTNQLALSQKQGKSLKFWIFRRRQQRCDHCVVTVWIKKKNKLYKPVNPTFIIHNWGVMEYTLHGHVLLMDLDFVGYQYV